MSHSSEQPKLQSRYVFGPQTRAMCRRVCVIDDPDRCDFAVTDVCLSCVSVLLCLACASVVCITVVYLLSVVHLVCGCRCVRARSRV